MNAFGIQRRGSAVAIRTPATVRWTSPSEPDRAIPSLEERHLVVQRSLRRQMLPASGLQFLHSGVGHDLFIEAEDPAYRTQQFLTEIGLAAAISERDQV
jgi:hypothetical protein